MTSPAAFIPFNKPAVVGRELEYVQEAITGKAGIAGNGYFVRQCEQWFTERIGSHAALLTGSCTHALEIAALLLDLQPGDEIIMPSYTFVTTANAFVLHGGTPVFVDIHADTMNIDERLIEDAITERTRAIVVMHYGGVSCRMGRIMELAEKHHLVVIEDAAQAMLSRFRDRPLGSFGQMATFSFHETKNYTSGEGGVLLLNDPAYQSRAEILREKGTNRNQFFRGEVDKYTWVDIGGSYLPSEIIAAFLYGQLEQAQSINNERLSIWNTYNEALAPLQARGDLRQPIIPENCEHNAHMYYFLTETPEARTELLSFLKAQGVSAVFHYVPLHTSPMGKSLGNNAGALPVTEDLSERIVRLPLYCGLSQGEQERVCRAVTEFYTGAKQITPVSSGKMVSNA